MQKGLLVKRLLSETAEKLLLRENIQDITVNDIIEEAGVSRTTFYRYFKDKFDLINYIYTHRVNEVADKYTYSQDPYKVTLELLKYFKEKRELYIRIFDYMGQNSFTEFFIKHLVDYDVELIKNVTGEEEISREDWYMVQYNAMGYATIIIVWLREGCIEEPKEVVRMLNEFIANKMLRYYVMSSQK